MPQGNATLPGHIPAGTHSGKNCVGQLIESKSSEVQHLAFTEKCSTKHKKNRNFARLKELLLQCLPKTENKGKLTIDLGVRPEQSLACLGSTIKKSTILFGPKVGRHLMISYGRQV